MFGRNNIYRYGFGHVSTYSNFHNIDCVMCGLKGFCRKQVGSYFLCGASHLITSNANNSGSSHFRLSSAVMEAVLFILDIIIRYSE